MSGGASRQGDEVKDSYDAATTNPLDRFSRLGELKSFDWPASPESAILIKASALRRSTAMYSSEVKIGQALESGRREKSGSSSGAWW